MHFLLRKQTGSDSSTVLDTEYEGSSISLGGDAAQVQLPGIGEQLEITAGRDGSAKLSAQKTHLTVNGKKRRKTRVKPGDTVSFAGYTLEVIQPPSGFDFALSVDIAAGSIELYEATSGSPSGGWSIRRVSWWLAIAVLIVGLVIPLSGVLVPSLAPTLRSTPLPDDGLWSSGPLVEAHRVSGIATDCQTCHEQPFVMVRDSACLSCHRNITEHVSKETHGLATLAEVRCATCHREHNEPERMLDPGNQLCVDCHAQPQKLNAGQAPDIRPVEAFTQAHHPDFKLGMLEPRGVDNWERVRRSRKDIDIGEQSNLKFDHQVHLNPDKVRDINEDSPLACADCHSLREDGEHFRPVAMDEDCRACHALSFDQFEPGLELPHGDLRAAIVAMEAHFIREFTDPELRKERADTKPRRVPGRREAAASCDGNGLDCGRAEALKEAEYQFANTGCITCHQVVDSEAADINDRWFVQPIRLANDWYPAGAFNHAAHLAIEWEDDREVCEACHDASNSKESTDILIPGQDNCLECHDQEKGDAAVDCVTCHAFHRREGVLSNLVREQALKSHGTLQQKEQ